MKQQLTNPPAMAKLAANNHFSSAVRVGDTIWLSGTVGLGPGRRPAAGMTAQAHSHSKPCAPPWLKPVRRWQTWSS